MGSPQIFAPNACGAVVKNSTLVEFLNDRLAQASYNKLCTPKKDRKSRIVLVREPSPMAGLFPEGTTIRSAVLGDMGTGFGR
jgi:hypothetical protein